MEGACTGYLTARWHYLRNDGILHLNGWAGAYSATDNTVCFVLSQHHPWSVIFFNHNSALLQTNAAWGRKTSPPKAATIFYVALACEMRRWFYMPPRPAALFLRSITAGEGLWWECSQALNAWPYFTWAPNEAKRFCKHYGWKRSRGMYRMILSMATTKIQPKIGRVSFFYVDEAEIISRTRAQYTLSLLQKQPFPSIHLHLRTVLEIVKLWLPTIPMSSFRLLSWYMFGN